MAASDGVSEASILIVDDEPHILDLLQRRLRSKGYHVIATTSGSEAIQAAKGTVLDLAVVDLKLGGGEDGLSVMEELRLINPHMPVIILTAHGSIANAVEAMRRGAYCYLTKPYKPDELLLHVQKALEKQHLTKEIEALKTILGDQFQEKNIVGHNHRMKEIFHQVQAIAPTDATVAIYGESGTGKELLAKTIHIKSHRAQGPFVPVNCGALPETLLENELFGHARGAYTDARDAKKGLFEQADKGTLFLDEIGDTSPAFQVKLLRVLQEKEVRPLGGGTPVKVNVRVIVSSNKSLQKAMERGEFREDLFYRIYVVPISLPPLRERKEDVPYLADHFLKEYVRESGKQVAGFTPRAMQKMMLYHWPGNIRELKNTIERAVILTSHDRIDHTDLIHMTESRPDGRADEKSPGEITNFKRAKELFEKRYLHQVLTRVHGNVSHAAKLADRYRGDVYRLMKKYGLRSEDFK
jgi:two-component system response regulator GlrR